jgi:serine/threonine-protein kinase
MIGETIKDFRITAKLGKGGMGEVWAAEQQIIKTRVAIKLLLADVSGDVQQVQRFFNEALAVAKIKHAGIVKIFDVGHHSGRAFLIMELLEGETLASRIARSGRLSLGAVADVGKQIASVLQATHAAGVTHRDLKPDNIFLVPDAELASEERVKILDFGIAKLSTSTTSGMTATGNSMGTPSYMAPEQWNNAAKADGRADVYALGCLVFEMCCGRPPFVAASIGEACSKHLAEMPVRASTLAPGVPPDLDDVIARMLAKQPDDRPTLKEIGAMFGTLASTQPHPMDATMQSTGMPAPSRPAVTAKPAPRSVTPDTTLGGAAASASTEPRPKRTGLLVGIGAVVVVGAVAAYVATRDKHETASRPTPAISPPVADKVAPPAPKVVPLEEPTEGNAWVKITPPASPVALGLDSDTAPTTARGFRPARKIHSPTSPYELQEHEVTWGEMDPWLAKTKTKVDYPAWATDSKARGALPVTGVTWTVAVAYCQSLDAVLPTEEQWEYAARGAERRPNSWGDDMLDRAQTHAFAGTAGKPLAVKTSPQDRTPVIADGRRIYDLIGNVQEWTVGLWREDQPGTDESWVQSGATSVRAIRGLPLAAEPTAAQPVGAAYRDHLCATGPCVDKGRDLRMFVGFRCSKS